MIKQSKVAVNRTNAIAREPCASTPCTCISSKTADIMPGTSSREAVPVPALDGCVQVWSRCPSIASSVALGPHRQAYGPDERVVVAETRPTYVARVGEGTRTLRALPLLVIPILGDMTSSGWTTSASLSTHPEAATAFFVELGRELEGETCRGTSGRPNRRPRFRPSRHLHDVDRTATVSSS